MILKLHQMLADTIVGYSLRWFVWIITILCGSQYQNNNDKLCISIYSIIVPIFMQNLLQLSLGCLSIYSDIQYNTLILSFLFSYKQFVRFEEEAVLQAVCMSIHPWIYFVWWYLMTHYVLIMALNCVGFINMQWINIRYRNWIQCQSCFWRLAYTEWGITMLDDS